MHKIMADLHQDHHNLARVLRIMESQLEHLVEGKHENLFLMQDATKYIQNYPDLIHHPKENKVFEVFKSRSDDAADIVARLSKEHQELPKATIKFQLMLDDAINGLGLVNREELVEKIKGFIKNEWEHMNLEEDVLFPLIDTTLTDDDWNVLDSQISEMSDPLFSDKIEESYKNLYQSIKTQAV